MRATTTTSDNAVYDALLHRVTRELSPRVLPGWVAAAPEEVDTANAQLILEGAYISGAVTDEQVEELLATGREIGQEVSLRREPRIVGAIGLPPGAPLYTDEDQLDDLVADAIANWHRDHHTKEN